MKREVTQHDADFRWVMFSLWWLCLLHDSIYQHLLPPPRRLFSSFPLTTSLLGADISSSQERGLKRKLSLRDNHPYLRALMSMSHFVQEAEEVPTSTTTPSHAFEVVSVNGRSVRVLGPRPSDPQESGPLSLTPS